LSAGLKTPAEKKGGEVQKWTREKWGMSRREKRQSSASHRILKLGLGMLGGIAGTPDADNDEAWDSFSW